MLLGKAGVLAKRRREELEHERKVAAIRAEGRPTPQGSAAQSEQAPETVSTQISRLREECHLTEEELAEKIDMDIRSVQRHLAGKVVPYARHLRIYERVFSKILNRQIVIRKMP